MVAKAAKHGHTITVADVELARAELKESFEKTLAGTSTSTTSHVYEPLMVNGETVSSGRVYRCVKGKADEAGKPYECKCFDCTGDEKAPKDGTIYLQGLRIFSSVIAPAVNGHAPAAKSSAKTIAKDELRLSLPISKYASYALTPGDDFILRVGGTAAVEATERGFVCDEAVINVLEQAA